MKSILLGNGINIQFSGKTYTSEFIVKRAYLNSKQNKYSELFANKIDGTKICLIFQKFVNIANKIIEGKYDDKEKDIELNEAIKEFKIRYKQKISRYNEIMVEDWFLLLRVFFIENVDLIDEWENSKQGFERILLDSIYNDGFLQELYKKMPANLKKYLLEFEKIFTLNYDNNIEKLTKKEVYHLHGSFDVLADSENPNTIFGKMREKNNMRVVQKGMEHCYCNALLHYSGKRKHSVAKKNIEFNLQIEKYRNDNKIKLATDEVNLLGNSTYHFDELESLTGELIIIGLTPANDSHIFESINKSGIQKIIFYSYEDIKGELPFEKDYEIRDVKKLWVDLGFDSNTYNRNDIKIPKGGIYDDFYKILDYISFDEVNIENVKSELKSLSEQEEKRLFDITCKTIVEQSNKEITITEEILSNNLIEISSIALREGISPKTLFLIVMRNLKKIQI